MNWQKLIDELGDDSDLKQGAFGIQETTEQWHLRLLRTKWRPRLLRAACRQKGIHEWKDPRGARDAYNEVVRQLCENGTDIDAAILSYEEQSQEREKERLLATLKKYYPEALEPAPAPSQ